jgi:hypothetical protein
MATIDESAASSEFISAPPFSASGAVPTWVNTTATSAATPIAQSMPRLPFIEPIGALTVTSLWMLSLS